MWAGCSSGARSCDVLLAIEGESVTSSQRTRNTEECSFTAIATDIETQRRNQRTDENPSETLLM
jgi:hypothetical protein